MKKYFTLMIIPQNASGVKKFKLRSIFFFGACLVSLLFLLTLSYIFYDYYHLQAKHINFDEYRMISEKNQKQILEYQNQYKQISNQILFLNKTATKLEYQLNDSLQDVHPITQEEKEILAEKQDNEDTLLKLIHASEEIQKLLVDNSNQEIDNIIQFIGNTNSYFDVIPRNWPIKGFLLFSFKQKSDPFTKNYFSDGIVIGSKKNQTVKAPANGVVIAIENDKGNNFILEIMHTRKLISRYSSLSKSLVQVGDQVKIGDSIGNVGINDTILAPHLYYQIIFDGIPQNPINYIQEQNL